MMTKGKKEHIRDKEIREWVDSEAKKITKEEASVETNANPGTDEKIIMLRARIIYDLPLFIEPIQDLKRVLPDERES